jgi:hypothetical protein
MTKNRYHRGQLKFSAGGAVLYADEATPHECRALGSAAAGALGLCYGDAAMGVAITVEALGTEEGTANRARFDVYSVRRLHYLQGCRSSRREDARLYDRAMSAERWLGRQSWDRSRTRQIAQTAYARRVTASISADAISCPPSTRP